MLAFVSQQKELNFIPGEEYLYCNTGYSLLAEVVARVSGLSFVEFTQQNIFKPLKMTHTTFVDDHEQIVKDRAYSYYSRDEVNHSKRILSYGNVGPTNLLTTAEDISLWMINAINPSVEYSRIFQQMMTEAKLNNGKTFGGGFGLSIHLENGIREIEHGGADAGFRAQVSMFPDHGFGVAVLSNDAQCDVRLVASEVVAYCLKGFVKTDIHANQEEKKENKFIKLKTKLMEPFVGHYWTKERAYTRYIYLKNDTLMHFRTENNESPLTPVGKNEFRVMNVPVDAIVRFEERNGEITLIETVNDGAPVLLERFVPVKYTDDDWLKYVGQYYSDELKTTYSIEWRENNLIANHIRMGTIGLKLVKHNFFMGDRGFFGSVEFLRDNYDNVTGFRLSNGRVRSLLFVRQDTSTWNNEK